MELRIPTKHIFDSCRLNATDSIFCQADFVVLDPHQKKVPLLREGRNRALAWQLAGVAALAGC